MRQPPKESSQSLSYHIALGGIIAALCIACMFLTGVFPMFYLILPMLASAFIYIMTLETGGYWGFLTYLSVGLLSVFVTPNKDASLAFLFFFGYFPLLRNGMERFRWKFLGFLLRLAVFNAAVLTFFWVSVYVLGMKELLGIANIMFFCYDFSMGSFPALYRRYLKPRISPGAHRES